MYVASALPTRVAAGEARPAELGFRALCSVRPRPLAKPGAHCHEPFPDLKLMVPRRILHDYALGRITLRAPTVPVPRLRKSHYALLRPEAQDA